MSSPTSGNSGDHHAFAPPAPPAEPKTPMWLPALGAVLFLMVGLIWGLMPETKPAEDGTANAAPSGSAAPADAGAAKH